MTTTAAEDDERHRLTAVQGLAALSLDALSSVAYGPEAILIVLVAAGAAGLHYSLPVTGAIIVLLTALVVSYRQVIEAFPNGGGAYAVSKAHLGTQASLVAAASLIVDYVLNAAVGVSAGIEALTSAFPVLYGASVWLCLGTLAIITGPAVQPGAPHLRPDRRAARDGRDAGTAGQAGVAGRRARRLAVAADGRGHLHGLVHWR
jgi:hypothetical protein